MCDRYIAHLNWADSKDCTHIWGLGPIARSGSSNSQGSSDHLYGGRSALCASCVGIALAPLLLQCQIENCWSGRAPIVLTQSSSKPVDKLPDLILDCVMDE